jgi:hypothetical protein
MSTVTQRAATIDDLHRVDGKAELIAGRIVHLMPTGVLPNRVAKRIMRSLDDHALQSGVGEAFTDNMGYELPKPLPNGRQSISPDVSYFVGPMPPNRMRFILGSPTFGVEVRSENDYGPAAERDMALKRADYFLAGTQAVWDVDPIAETVALYRASDPTTPVVFRRGDVAHAEPAIPGWTMPVDAIFS